ncbi:hypothetical protein DL771_007358 [Monosporascus sp. 5C6A]|nr:hypothetical protein DL771_007358 [Monosporascus sp. 5C6A]
MVVDEGPGEICAKTSLLQSAQLLLTTCILQPVGGTDVQLAAVTKECPPKIHPSLQPHGLFGCPVAIDEETAGPRPIDWSPWTHPPVCLTAGYDRKDGTKYCIYTNSAYGHSGVSLITTPDTAANIVELLDDFNPDFMREQLDPYRSTSNRTYAVPIRRDTGTGLPESTGKRRSYEVVDIPYKGKGVVATRRIKRGEVIMVDFASLVLHLAFPGSVRRLDGYELLLKAAGQLAEPEKVLGLARRRDHPPNVVEDVLRTNSFQFELDDKPHMALYADIAVSLPESFEKAYVKVDRLTSESIEDKPWLQPESSQSSLAARVIAFRDIEPGEELSLSYVDVGKTHEERQRALQRWGFTCTCAMCTASDSQIAASDARRTRIRALKAGIVEVLNVRDGSNKSKSGNLDRAIEMAHEVVVLVRREELRSLYAEQYDVLGRLYWAAGDRARAVAHARLSLKALEDIGYIEPDEEHLPKLLATYGEAGSGGQR